MSKASKFSFLFFASYFIAFPFCYFRHDDWLILGTAVKHMPEDWGLLWRATLYYAPDRPSVWFFRPVFKLLTYLNFSIFGYQHLLWLLSELLLLLCTLLFASKALYYVRKLSSDVDLFLVSFAFCLPLHFGSLVWIGEGLMNIPQVFFLSIAVYGFVKDQKLKIDGILLSLLGYVFALLSKESSVVFPGLLFLISFRFRSFKKDISPLVAHLVLTLVYLFVRFTYFKVNPGYHPLFDFLHFIRPLFLFLLICFLGPAVFFSLTYFREPKKCLKAFDTTNLLLFGTFVLLLILPHLGHWFFSPGWFFLPGFWAAWSFPLFFKDTGLLQKKYYLAALILIVLSGVPTLFQLKSLGWQHWGNIQKQLHEMVANLNSEEVKVLYIQDCENAEYPNSDLSRVAGSADSIMHIWHLSHKNIIRVKELGCTAAIPTDAGSRVIYFKFPDLVLK